MSTNAGKEPGRRDGARAAAAGEPQPSGGARRSPLAFVSYQSRRRGLIAELLACCYAPLLEQLSAARADSLRRDWAEYDDAMHAEPETIGRAGFFSLLEDQVIGFASWDPRGWPDIGRVGHNCVVPRYQGRGFGRC